MEFRNDHKAEKGNRYACSESKAGLAVCRFHPHISFGTDANFQNESLTRGHIEESGAISWKASHYCVSDQDR